MITLILVRHGETNWNVAGRLAGLIDEAVLTDEGEKQAIALSKKLKNLKIDLIYTSELKRAIQTARIIAKHLKKKVIRSAAFNERSWGIFEGKNWEKTKNVLIRTYETDRDNLRPEGGETYQEFKKRVFWEIEKIIKIEDGRKILIVTHGGVVRVLIKFLKNLSDQEMQGIKVYNTSLTIFKMNAGKVEEELIADVEHLN